MPAAAQSGKPMNQNQCEDQFKAADINNDGLLSSTEIGNAKIWTTWTAIQEKAHSDPPSARLLDLATA